MAEDVSITLRLGDVVVEHFEKGLEEDAWLGTVRIFGTPHHFCAIKVADDGSGVLHGTNDPHERLEDLYRLYEYPPVTTEIPGLEGEFVIYVHPHGD